MVDDSLRVIHIIKVLPVVIIFAKAGIVYGFFWLCNLRFLIEGLRCYKITGNNFMILFNANIPSYST